MSGGAEKAARRGDRERKVTRPEAALIALRATRIGPVFPEAVPTPREPRKFVRGGKDTKPPYLTRRQRKPKNNVIVRCRLCPFTATGSTWRPTRSRAADHRAKKHAEKAA